MVLYTCNFLLILATLSWSRPLHQYKSAEILSFGSKNSHSGKYSFSFESSDGIQREETGLILNPESKSPNLVVRGFYTYVRDDGQTFNVHYIADENGFRPELALSKPEEPAAPIETTVAPSLNTPTEGNVLPQTSSDIYIPESSTILDEYKILKTATPVEVAEPIKLHTDKPELNNNEAKR